MRRSVKFAAGRSRRYLYAPRSELPRLVALYIVWEGALLTLAWRLSYIWFVAKTPRGSPSAVWLRTGGECGRC